MAEVRLTAKSRTDRGKGAARRLRASGRVPGILYGRGMNPVALDVDRREFVTALHTDAGMNVLLDIEIDGETTLALAKEIQRDPVRGVVLHTDFVKIDRKVAIEVEVPVHLTGESPGVEEGGVLEHPLFAVEVRTLPTDVPESITGDISGLAIGDSLRVSELPTSDKYEILTDPDTIVALVAAPISEEELEAMEAEAGVVQEESEAEIAEREAAAAAEGEEGAEPGDASPEEGEGSE